MIKVSSIGAYKITPEFYAKNSQIMKQNGMTFLKDNNENGIMSMMTSKSKQEVNNLLSEKNIYDVVFTKKCSKEIHSIISGICKSLLNNSKTWTQAVEDSNLLSTLKSHINNASKNQVELLFK